jgi:hypothetical protein
MRSLKFLNVTNLPAASLPWGLLSLQQKLVPEDLPWGKMLPGHKANNLTAIWKPID